MFDKYLLDGDWSVCAGNWMWVSSSAFENCLQCPNCFSPVMYGMRMDPTGEFIRSVWDGRGIWEGENTSGTDGEELSI